MKKANSRGAKIFTQTLFSMYRVTQKNKPLFLKYFLGGYKLKMMEILYTKHWAILFIRRTAFEKTLKIFEAEDRTNWKSKKKGLHVRRRPVFTTEDR